MTKKRDFLTPATNLALVLLNSVKKIPTWQTLLELGWRILSITLWAILILVVLSSFGRHFAFGNTLAAPMANTAEAASNSTVVIKAVELDAALSAAREAALKTASSELDIWINALMSRVDSSQDVDFLDWYFGYWTQQKFSLDGILQNGKRVLSKNSPTAKEEIQQEVLEEFINRVLQLEIAEPELETILGHISQIYTSELGKFSSSLLGPLATVAIIASDVADVHNTEVKYRPILKQNIEGYFSLMKKDILNNEQSGIQKVILDIEKSVRKGMSGSHSPSLSISWS